MAVHSLRYWSLTHFENDHRDYLAWKRSKARLSTTILIASAVIAEIVFFSLVIFGLVPFSVSPIQTVRGGPFVGVPFLSAFVVFAIFRASLSWFGIRKFKRDWEARGGVPIPSSDLDLSK